MIKDVKIKSELVQQFRDLTCKEEKLFYYAFGKFQVKLASIENQTDKEVSETEELHDYSVTVPYDDVKLLHGIKRVDNSNFRAIQDKLLSNAASFRIDNTVFYLFDSIKFSNERRMIDIKFNENIELLIGNLFNESFVVLEIADAIKIKGNKEFKLFLLALSLLRGNKGFIKYKLATLREILEPNSKLDNTMFFYRFVSKPAEKLNNIKGLNIKISCSREMDLVNFSVSR